MDFEQVLMCANNPGYFIDQFCWIEDKVQRRWVRFRLWKSQREVVQMMAVNRQVIVLKARQLGLTWLAVGYGLWTMLFRQGAGVLLFSRREDEAQELLERVRGMNSRLPKALQGKWTVNNAQELRMGESGSWARCFPTSKHSGRSYAATLAIVDEADFIPNMRGLMNAVKPTIDGGGLKGKSAPSAWQFGKEPNCMGWNKGGIVLISTANKEDTGSEFKRIWRRAVKGMNHYKPVFLPWDAHPGRDHAWYARQAADYEEDDLFQEYPASPAEALAAMKSSKRFHPRWIEECRTPLLSPLKGGGLEESGIPGLRVFRRPERGRTYLVAGDPAEGNPSSDPSAASVFDCESWEQVAVLHGRFEPDIFANYMVRTAEVFNGARVCWERNNHGHAVEVAIKNLGYERVYVSPFDQKVGWLSNRKYKVLAVDHAAMVMREGGCRLWDEATIQELAALEAGTLKAPPGEHDDLAMTVVIGLAALYWKSHEEIKGEGISKVIHGKDPLDDLNF